MTLTKRDLVIRISNETGLVQQQVLDVVQKTLDYIAEALAKGDIGVGSGSAVLPGVRLVVFGHVDSLVP